MAEYLIEAYLVEGFDAGGKLYAKIVHFTVDEARNVAAEFARHYTTVTTTPLARLPANLPQNPAKTEGS